MASYMIKIVIIMFIRMIIPPHRMFAQKLGERFHKGRFLYINAWRNISDTPIGIHKDIIKIKYNGHIDHDPLNNKHLCELIIINDDNPIMMIIVGLGR